MSRLMETEDPKDQALHRQKNPIWLSIGAMARGELSTTVTNKKRTQALHNCPTRTVPDPGDYPLKSPKSRAAARAMAEAQKDEGVTIIHQLDPSGPDSTETDDPKSVALLVKRMRDNGRPLLVRHKFS